MDGSSIEEGNMRCVKSGRSQASQAEGRAGPAFNFGLASWVGVSKILASDWSKTFYLLRRPPFFVDFG